MISLFLFLFFSEVFHENWELALSASSLCKFCVSIVPFCFFIWWTFCICQRSFRYISNVSVFLKSRKQAGNRYKSESTKEGPFVSFQSWKERNKENIKSTFWNLDCFVPRNDVGTKPPALSTDSEEVQRASPLKGGTQKLDSCVRRNNRNHRSSKKQKTLFIAKRE